MIVVDARKQMMPDAYPIENPPIGPMQPEAGVTAARPAIAPVAQPSTLGLPCLIHSIAIHVSAAVDAEM